MCVNQQKMVQAGKMNSFTLLTFVLNALVLTSTRCRTRMKSGSAVKSVKVGIVFSHFYNASHSLNLSEARSRPQ